MQQQQQQLASLFIGLPVFCPNFVVIMQYSRFLQQLCPGLTSSGTWHCHVVCVSWCFQRMHAFETLISKPVSLVLFFGVYGVESGSFGSLYTFICLVFKCCANN
jgi:hypothetical protein